MHRVEIATHLGENTVPLTAILADHLADSLGIPVIFDPGTPDETRLRRIEDGAYGLVWMCGLLTVELLDTARLDATIVAAPVFNGQNEPIYHSVIISRADAVSPDVYGFHGATVAINERASWSGHHALRSHLLALDMPDPFFRAVVETGSHAQSIEAVLGGRAHIAAIDNSVWDHALAERPELAEAIRIVDTTESWPAPPFSISSRVEPALAAAIAADLIAAFKDPETAHALRTYRLDGIRAATAADYDGIRQARKTSDRLSW